MEKVTRLCPVCGEPIDAHAQICPICGEPTGFPAEAPVQPSPQEEERTIQDSSLIDSQEEVVPPPIVETPVPEVKPEAVVTPPPIPKPAAVPPPIPPATPVPPTPVVEEKKQSSWGWIAFTLLLLAVIGAGVYFLFFNDNKSDTQETVPTVSVAEKSAVEVIDSIQKVLPPGAQTVLRVTSGDAPCLFFLNNGHFHRFDAKEKQTIEIDLASLNPEASVDILKGGIIKATPTPDEKDILLVVIPKNSERALYKYNVEGSRVDVLGVGEIEEYGSGYIIHGINNERHIDNTGNITREFDPGLPEELQNTEKKSQPVQTKPRSQTKTPKPSEPATTAPSEPEPPVENQGTGFRLEPI